MKFEFNLYSLNKYWTRELVTVEVDSQEEAIKKTQEFLYESDDFEVLYETQETLSCELEDKEGNILATW